jgi:hypothetical protein
MFKKIRKFCTDENSNTVLKMKIKARELCCGTFMDSLQVPSRSKLRLLLCTYHKMI